MRRVVITGLGMVAASGNSVPQSWETVLSGRSAVDTVSLFDAGELPVRIAAEVRQFDATTVMSAKQARQSSRFIQFAAAAAREALLDSQLDVQRAPERYGCFIGAGLGDIGEIEAQSLVLAERGARRVSPLIIPYTIPNMAAGVCSVLENLKGPNFSVTSACASGTHSIGEAFMHIAMGTADAIVAGGSESTISPLCVAGFARMQALSTRNDAPAAASRPFDRDRDGFVMGEGCGVLLLEEYEHARQRGAKIYAELTGYGLSADAHHITMPSAEGEGTARAISAALKAARIDLAEVDYINAHGTSTPANDTTESAAIETVFGEHARDISISSTKGVTGHCLGAAGAIEAVFTVLAIHHGVVPPTANLDNPDPSCRLDYTPREARRRPIRHALNNSCGFGGQNACLAFSRI